MTVRWLLCLLVLTSVPASAATASGSVDAVTYQIDTAHSGRSTLSGFTGQLTQLWTRNLGGGISYPLIANGFVYVTVAAGTATTLYALDPGSGNTVWQAPIPGDEPVSSLAYDDGQIFIVNLSGLVESFNATTGTHRWNTQLPREWFFPWPLIALRGTVFVGGQGTAGQLYALSEKSGHIVWQAMVKDAGTPVAYNKLVAITSPCEEYYGFAAKTGEWLWTDETLNSEGGGFTPVYYNGHLFVRDNCLSFSNRMVSAKSGSIGAKFKADLPPSFFTLDGNDFIVALVSGSLTATPVKGTAPRWTFNGDGELSSAPLVVDNYVIEGSASGNLYILDESDGHVISSYGVGAGIEAPQEGGQTQPLTGLGAANGVLIVPAGSQLVAFAPQ